jgi:adenylate kinase
MLNLIVIGAQGSGKGTQANLLTKRLGIQQLSSGDIFRSAIANGTAVGLEAKQYMDRGELVPDTITVRLILDLLATSDFANGVILDGFPRTYDQARVLDEALPAQNRAIDHVIYLNVPRENLMDRLLNRYVCTAHQHVYNIKTYPPKVPGICDIDGSALIQRSDDTPDKITRRLDIFFDQTIQAVHYYKMQGKLIEIDGNQPAEQVSEVLLQKLGV